jgi:hypothetical protein
MHRLGIWLPGEREKWVGWGGGTTTRRDKDRNERFEPRNKNKQSLNPKQQWNSQLGLGCVSSGGGHFLGSLYPLPWLGFHSTHILSNECLF